MATIKELLISAVIAAVIITVAHLTVFGTVIRSFSENWGS